MDKVLLINKEKGMTSRAVCDYISNILEEKKIGHFGTLDPVATGLLVLGVGSLTKIGNLFKNTNKEYEVEVLVGTSTDTYDITGNILKVSNKTITLDYLEKVLKSFICTYEQEVPIYSAVRVEGKRLYEYAREGKDVSLPKKEVTIYDIHDIKLLKRDGHNYFSFKTLVSSGTYIRSLINDISKKIDIPLCMSALNRTMCCGFKLENANSIRDIETNNYKALSLEDVLDIEVKEIPKSLENSILNGNKISKISDKMILFRKDNKDIVLYGVYNEEMKPYLTFKK